MALGAALVRRDGYVPASCAGAARPASARTLSTLLLGDDESAALPMRARIGYLGDHGIAAVALEHAALDGASATRYPDRVAERVSRQEFLDPTDTLGLGVLLARVWRARESGQAPRWNNATVGIVGEPIDLEVRVVRCAASACDARRARGGGSRPGASPTPVWCSG